MGSKVKRSRGLSLLCILPLAGCHSLILCNVGIANKQAAGQAVPFPAQAYCMALAVPDIDIRGHIKKTPDISQEQREFCKEVEAAAKEKK